MLKLGYTLPNLAIICLHKNTDAKFYPFIKEDKGLLQKIRKDMVVVHPLGPIRLRVKQSLTKPSIGNQLICANQLLVSTRVKCIPTQCVKPSKQDFYAMGSQYGDRQIYTTTEQDPHIRNFFHVPFSTNKTRI